MRPYRPKRVYSSHDVRDLAITWMIFLSLLFYVYLRQVAYHLPSVLLLLIARKQLVGLTVGSTTVSTGRASAKKALYATQMSRTKLLDRKIYC